MDQKNTWIAIGLSALVLIAWQYFFAVPQVEKQRQAQQTVEQTVPTTTAPSQPSQPGAAPTPQTPASPTAAAPQPPGQAQAPAQPATRESALAETPRIPIDTPLLRGSIGLKGGRIDDLSLVKFRETVDPNSPPIVLLSPSGSPHPFYAEFGWVPASGTSLKLPNATTQWTQQGGGTLTINHPVTLVYDNGAGLTFHRTISVDSQYLFSVRDEVVNHGTSPVTLYPYALVSRHGKPQKRAYFILHEGLVGVLGDKGLQEVSYSKIEDEKSINFNVTNAWLGITDKYWAATLLPDPKAHVQARFSSNVSGKVTSYQTDYLLDPVKVAPGATGSAQTRLFAGAKEVATVDAYDAKLGLNRFELLIDWGWFYFITKPMFKALDFFYHLVGNFGIAILIVTVLVKIIFFPLANKSYASMAKMKAVQPEMKMIRERYADDKMKQQQAMMELYKKEKVNPVAGCLPMVIQIPVFFSLYKVLFVTIEMRHAPFFGWIQDLSAPDPTNLFTLFGLLPIDPTQLPMIGSFLHVGIWPLIMGVTMWAQMKLNPPPPDPTQQMIFNWMPLIFLFMLAGFPAGLVIYWAWNNSLSVAQQSVIMRRHGAKIELWDNVKRLFVRAKEPAE